MPFVTICLRTRIPARVSIYLCTYVFSGPVSKFSTYILPIPQHTFEVVVNQIKSLYLFISKIRERKKKIKIIYVVQSVVKSGRFYDRDYSFSLCTTYQSKISTRPAEWRILSFSRSSGITCGLLPCPRNPPLENHLSFNRLPA